MTKTLIKLLQLLDKKNKRNFPLIFLMMLVEIVLETVGISLVVPLISSIMDENIISKNELIGSVCGFFHIYDHRSLIISCIVALICVYVFKNIFILIECKVRYGFICESRYNVQKKIFRSILDRPYEYFLNAQTGEIIREVADDCNRTFSLFGSLIEVYANIFLTVGIVAVLFVIDPKMTLVVMSMMALLSLILVLIIRPVLKKQGSILVKYATENYKNLLEAVQGIKIVKITRSKDYFNEEFKKNGKKVIEADMKNNVINRIPSALIEAVCVTTVLLYVLFVFVSGNDINELIPSSGAFVVASLKLIPSVNKVINAYSAIAYNKESVDKVYENYSKISDEDVHTDFERLVLKDRIELKDITYRYPNSDRKILNDASLTIPVGKSVGIMGLSGIGKTTAADVLLGLLFPENGSIAFDDKVMKVDIDNYPINIGYVPQTIYIRDDSIRSNIAFGIPDADIDDDKINEVIKTAQLEDYIEKLPEGINTLIGENGIRVSGGQRQRIGIARALYNDPDLLIFDEATSALDLETEACIMRSINALHGTKTMLIIAHRPQIIEGCDYIYKMVDGRFVLEK